MNSIIITNNTCLALTTIQYQSKHILHINSLSSYDNLKISYDKVLTDVKKAEKSGIKT